MIWNCNSFEPPDKGTLVASSPDTGPRFGPGFDPDAPLPAEIRQVLALKVDPGDFHNRDSQVRRIADGIQRLGQFVPAPDRRAAYAALMDSLRGL